MRMHRYDARFHLAMCIAALLAPTFADAGAARAQTAAAPQGFWQQEKAESRSAEVPAHPCYARSYRGGQGSATISSRLTCGNQPWSGTVSASWSSPPGTLVPGQQVRVSVAARASAAHTGITAGLTVDARFDTERCGQTRNAIKIAEVIVASHDPARQAAEKTGTAVVPGPGWNRGVKELDGKLLLRVCMDGWQAYFWYGWRTGPPPATPSTEFVPVRPPPAEPPAAAPPAPVAKPKREDSGVRFSDLRGQVEWRPGDDEEDWRLAKLNDVLPVDAHIKTYANSSAVIGFRDMSVFVLKPETEIILSPPAPKASQIKLLWGNLWANIRKMMKDNSMEVDMSPAVLGVKGTIFSATARPGMAEVAVCEGAVDLTHKRSRETITIGPGEKGVATADGLQRIHVGVRSLCDEYAAALRSPSTLRGPQAPVILFDNGNGDTIQTGMPSRQTAITLTVPHRITQIRNYHWHGAGAPPGQISLVGPVGVVGTWQATGVPGSGRQNVYWVVRPNLTLPAGTYTIRDSDPATWSHNAQSRHAGMTQIEGQPAQ